MLIVMEVMRMAGVRKSRTLCCGAMNQARQRIEHCQHERNHERRQPISACAPYVM